MMSLELGAAISTSVIAVAALILTFRMSLWLIRETYTSRMPKDSAEIPADSKPPLNANTGDKVSAP